MPNTILLIEDNQKILQVNARMLQKSGYSILTAEKLSDARIQLLTNKPDIIVLDIMLPDGDGLSFIAEIRKLTSAPILLLTALTEKSDLLAGLRAGGDDYITKPYDLDELRERIAAFLRREALRAKGESPHIISYGPLVLDTVSVHATIHGEDMMLSSKEFALLGLLVHYRNTLLSKEFIYETIWKQPTNDDARVVWTHISALKKKLAAHGGELEIKTRRGKGYCLERHHDSLN